MNNPFQNFTSDPSAMEGFFMHIHFQTKDTMLKELRTVKKAAQIIGISTRFIERLLQEEKLTKYKIKSAVFISLVEFEEISKPVTKIVKAYSKSE